MPLLARYAGLLLAIAINLLPVSPALAQRMRENPDEAIVERAKLVAANERIELHADNVPVDAAFLRVLDDTYARIEKLLGHAHDKVALGEKIRVYVTGATNVSHVWRGYEHPREPRGILFLSRQAYFAGTRGENATYAHEMTHLFTWRFHSHTLREGLADFIALEILPGAAVGPNVKGYDSSQTLPPEVLERLGSTAVPPPWATNDPVLRQAYYFGSYRLVKHLVAQGGLSKFMQLYAAEDVEAAFVALYGKPREEIVKALGQ